MRFRAGGMNLKDVTGGEFYSPPVIFYMVSGISFRLLNGDFDIVIIKGTEINCTVHIQVDPKIEIICT